MIKFVKYNSYRKEKYKCITLYKDNYFLKKAQSPKALEFLNSFIDKYKIVTKLDIPFHIVKPIKLENEIRFKKIDGQTLRSLFEQELQKKNNKYIIKEIENFINILSKESNVIHLSEIKEEDREDIKKIFGSSLLNNKKWLKVGIIDLIFDNIIVDKKGKKYLIDYEWTWNFPIPLEFIIFRSIYTFLSYLKFKGYDIKTIYNHFEYILKEKYIKAEYNFLKYVSRSIVNYQKFKENILVNIKKDYSKITFIDDRLKEIMNLNLLLDKKSKYIKELESRNEKLEKELSAFMVNNKKLYEENLRLKSILSRRSVRLALKLADLFRKIINKIKF